MGGSWAVLYLAPVVGTVCAQLMFASPMPAVLRARQENNLRDLNVVPFPLIVANCVGWIVYSEAPAAPYLLPCRCHPLPSPLDPPQRPELGPSPNPCIQVPRKTSVSGLLTRGLSRLGTQATGSRTTSFFSPTSPGCSWGSTTSSAGMVVQDRRRGKSSKLCFSSLLFC